MLLVQDLGLMPYRDAWALQEEAHAQVLAGEHERVLLVEHPPVITFGRRPGLRKNIIASSELLEQRGVEVVESDRGGDVTFHGPGQLVAYPIIRLSDHKLSISAYVHRLEDVIIATLAACGVASHKDPCAIGVWTRHRATDAKIAAIGVRIRRGVTMHGLALNVNVDLNYFSLIIPCGLPDRPITSLQQLLGVVSPSMEQVKSLLANQLQVAFKSGLGILPEHSGGAIL